MIAGTKAKEKDHATEKTDARGRQAGIPPRARGQCVRFGGATRGVRPLDEASKQAIREALSSYLKPYLRG
jgi:hypothetical protein